MSDQHMISKDTDFDRAIDELRDVDAPDPVRAAATRQAILDAFAKDVPSNVRPLRRGSLFARALLLAAALGGTAFAANNTVRWVSARRAAQQSQRDRDAQASLARVASSHRSRSVNARRAPALPVTEPSSTAVIAAPTLATATEPTITTQPTAEAPARPVALAPAPRPRASSVGPRITEAPARVEPTVAANSAVEPANNAQPTAAASGPDALYREAHHAHFVERSASVALARWDQYLSAAPDGRFAPEAQFNRIVCLVRLGRTQQALDAIDALPASHYRHDDAVRLRARLADGGSP